MKEESKDMKEESKDMKEESIELDETRVRNAALRAISYLRQRYSIVTKAMEGALPEVGSEFGESDTTVYTYLSEKFPLVVDDAIPPVAIKEMVEHGTFACTDTKNVYIDTRLFAKKYPHIMSRFLSEKGYTGRDLEQTKIHIKTSLEGYVQRDIATLIGHEYTHILMCHQERGNRFARLSKNAKNIGTFNLACEIEANRGMMVDNMSAVYAVAVTDRAFPEVKGVYGLQNIYETLKRHHGDDIDNEVSYQQQQQQEQSQSQGQKQKQKSQGQGEGESQEQSQSQGQKQKQKSQGQGEGESQEQSQEQQQPSTSSGNNSLNDEQKRAIAEAVKDLKEMADKAQSEGNQRSYEAQTQSQNGQGYSIGHQQEAGNPYGEDKVPGLDEAVENGQTSLAEQAAAAVVLRRAIKQDMSKLKGILSGADIAVGIEKTYSRQSRKEADTGLMKKGIKRGKQHAPRVLIAMDSSGSMQGTTSKQILRAIMEVMKVVGRSVQGSWVCMHDIVVSNLLPLHEYEKVVKCFRGSGGNSFNKVLQAALDKDVEMVINVGDGQDYIEDIKLLEQAKKKGLKWVDVLISRDSSKREVGYIRRREYESLVHLVGEKKAKEIQMKRTVLKLN